MVYTYTSMYIVPKGFYFTTMRVIRSKSNMAVDDVITNSKSRVF